MEARRTEAVTKELPGTAAKSRFQSTQLPLIALTDSLEPLFGRPVRGLGLGNPFVSGSDELVGEVTHFQKQGPPFDAAAW